MTPEQKLKDIVPGQLVEVTFRGHVDDVNENGVSVTIEGGAGQNWFNLTDVSTPPFKIEPIEEPITVGCEVRHRSAGNGIVKHIDGNMAFIRGMMGDYWTARVTRLERIK